MKKPDQKLKAKWYKKAGFDDPESPHFDIEQDEIYFKGRGTSVIDYRQAAWESTSEYYYLATMFLQEHKFKSNLERIIWEYHSNGLSVVDIAETLTKVRRRKLGRMTVWRALKKLELIMKKQYGVIK